MASIKGSQTEKNLLKSFAGESQARNRYTYFAKIADKEGYKQIAAIFLETADNERVHAKSMFKFLEGGTVEITASYPAGILGSTEENLAAAAEGENEEHSVLYPEFARVAAEEGFPQVAALYKNISNAERWHEERYRGLLKNVTNGAVFKKENSVRWKCDKCGYIHEGTDAPGKCAACNHPQSYFQVVATNW